MADKDRSNSSKKSSIPKVVEFNPNNVMNGLEQIMEMAKQKQINNFIFAAFTPENTVTLVRADVDLIEHQHLVSYLQTDVTLRTIYEGYDMILLDGYDDYDDYDDDDDDDDDD